MSKLKCFLCHQLEHYASQCPKKKKKKKKGKGTRMQVAASIETQLSELTTKSKDDFSLVYCLSTSTIARIAWYLDNGASHHMTEARELFSGISDDDSGIHVELGDDAKYVVKGQATV